MNITNAHDRFDSTDIYLCSFLVTRGAVLDGVERDASGKVRFLLHAESKGVLDEWVRAYWSSEPVLLVPSRLLGSLKHLKSLLHSHP